MSSLLLGQDAAGRPLRLTEKHRRGTHTHVIGGSGTGKSKFLEWLVRRDIRAGAGLCVIDWHGKLYSDVLRYCAYHGVGRPGDFRSVVLLNPSEPDFITGFNPFIGGGGDISARVSRRVDATIRPWGVTNTDQTPTFARICGLLYTFMIEQGQTLPNAAALLQFKNRALRDYAANSVNDPVARGEWEELLSITKFQDWKNEVLSTKNRLMRFVGLQSVRRFMGLPFGNVDLMQIMEKGQILLINLGHSDFLDREAARVFASLLLNEFFETAMRRGARADERTQPKLFSLYLDEFQEYVTDDVSSMLDQVRKGGLHLVLAHQHLGHFSDNQRLQESVFTNARIRAVFGGLPVPSARYLAEEMFLPDLNTRQVKKAYYHTIHLYEEQTRIIRGKSTSRGAAQSCSMANSLSGPIESEGWFTRQELLNLSESEGCGYSETEQESESETEVPVFVPIPTQELSSETEWSLEEKVSRVAEMLKCQQQRHCFIKLDTEKTQPLKVPLVRDFVSPPALLARYQQALYERQGALPAREVDRLIAERTRAFLSDPSYNPVGVPTIELSAPAGRQDDSEFYE